MTCRYYGISRLTYSGWLRRYETEGVDGMRDRSKRPRTSPNATPADVIEKIIHPRRHDHFGPRKILMCLQRCIVLLPLLPLHRGGGHLRAKPASVSPP